MYKYKKILYLLISLDRSTVITKFEFLVKLKVLLKRYPINRHFSYGLARDDFDGRIENYPCIIVIQLSKGRYEDEDDKRNKKYERIPIHGENDYVEDNDESKMRNVQIQVKNEKLVIFLISFYDLCRNIYIFFQMVKSENPKLHIKISRSDTEKDIKIMDKLNITVRDQY